MNDNQIETCLRAVGATVLRDSESRGRDNDMVLMTRGNLREFVEQVLTEARDSGENDLGKPT